MLNVVNAYTKNTLSEDLNYVCKGLVMYNNFC